MMTDLETAFRTLWLDYCDGKIPSERWQAMLTDTPGLKRWVCQVREREMSEQNRNAHRAARWR